MARRAEANFVITGDASGAERAFDHVGDAARDMASDVGSSAKRMSDDMDKGTRSIGDGIDASESKFRGLGDTIAGTGDIMQGFKDGNIAGIAMGFADLAGGITDFVVPALGAMKGAILTGLAPALTAISAHPLIAGILAGGVIILGLIALEKKFGIVSGAVEALKGVFDGVWPAIRGTLNLIVGGLEAVGNAAIDVATAPIGLLNKIPGVKSIVPNVPHISLPRFHQGGVVPGVGDQLAVLQGGETVLPRGATGGGVSIVVQGSVITERDLGRIVADALRQNKLIGVT
ncbi:MAG TPA: hypothetical protein VJS45_07680 [Acidimicrobiia bacterium]|nr:hypothetical protein [Acidimicrobiia bacterium]